MKAVLIAAAITAVSVGAIAHNAKANMMNPTRAEISQAQQALRQEGYRVSTDGIWGPRTANATAAYQRANSLEETGTLDKATMNSLLIDASGDTSTNSNAPLENNMGTGQPNTNASGF